MVSVPGGIGELKPADDTVNDICAKIRAEVENKAGKQFVEFTAINYASQLVNGVNYFIKVKVADAEHIHIRVHKAFSGELSFHSHQANKSADDSIEYFP
ncbi:cell cycle-regulated histone H1-binding protein-like protein [Leptotrombidium deliense]|uniref:Cell cycle-regulated histone H1-binding protein-like protein n=1 Tax=Leptotrombidium deliense TaxID=299467 RepID=A0A443SN27_9ACAR|nr:cell cycle-regulated histone H1-binding protein-like protein [Leptotrombidium deliense]